jgi:hypothetical protein
MKLIEKLACACGLLLALGCGGESDSDDGDGGSGGGGGGGEVDTGLPEDVPLESVTAQQYANACESLREDVRTRLGPDIATRGACEVYGAGVADETAACESTADTCVSEANAGTQMFINRDQLDFTNFECGDVGELEGCSVTVGEFETCLEDQMTAFETLMAENNCSNAGSINLVQALALGQNLIGGGSSPPSCARVQQECPGVGPFGEL